MCRSQSGSRAEGRKLDATTQGPVLLGGNSHVPESTGNFVLGFGAVPQEYQSLYRRFRPATFSDVLGQDHVTHALKGAVQSNKVGHAYLFSGPRGTGKTSTARIFAKGLNCLKPKAGEPCCKCDSCLSIAQGTSLDVHELDAASNNGVDAMRDLVARSALATPGKWKVYIIDEVHMLSTSASNALLKTLEEPPSRVVFILATTDPQKVLPTIRSRTQHFEFHLLASDVINSLLAQVISQAELSVDNQMVASVIRRARGSARDALSALDQASTGGVVEDIGLCLQAIVESILARDTKEVLLKLAETINQGFDPQVIATELLERMRNGFLAIFAPELVELEDNEKSEVALQAKRAGLATLVRTMEIIGTTLVNMRSSVDPRITLEVALVRASHPELDTSLESIVERLDKLERGGPRNTQGPESPSGPRNTQSPESPSGPRTIPGPESSGQLHSQGPERSGQLRSNTSTSDTIDSRYSCSPKLSDLKIKSSEATILKPSSSPRSATQRLTERYGRGNRIMPSSAPDTNISAVSERPPDNNITAVSESHYPSRDEMTLAWGNGILASLGTKARSCFQYGRFVESEPGTTVFAVPSVAYEKKCLESISEVRNALTSFFGVDIDLAITRDISDNDVSAANQSTEPLEESEEYSLSLDQYLDENQASVNATEIFLKDFPDSVEISQTTNDN